MCFVNSERRGKPIEMKDAEKNKKKMFWLISWMMCLLVAIVAFAIMLVSMEKREAADSQYEQLAQEANTPEVVSYNELFPNEDAKIPDLEIPEQPDVLAMYGITIPEKNLDWDELHDVNEDIYAWIYVPDTTVDYPVLQHPSNNSYYLNRNLDGSSGYPGCIYTENYNSKSFSDPNTVLYGHNLKDQTMFSSLHNFENPELVNEDHFIFVYTPERVFVYRVFAAYEFSNKHLLLNYNLDNIYDFESYLKEILNHEDPVVCNIRQDIPLTYSNQIITLSTCTSSHNSNKRFLVQGVLLNTI
ncbi:MAG: class B sortase [Lachnospiraceae bacterium]